MATSEQVKSLVKSYVEHDDERFKTIVLQIAAYEAQLGHDKIAQDLKKLILKSNIMLINYLILILKMISSNVVSF